MLPDTAFMVACSSKKISCPTTRSEFSHGRLLIRGGIPWLTTRRQAARGQLPVEVGFHGQLPLGNRNPSRAARLLASSGVALLDGHHSCIMSRFESAPGAEVSDEDDVSLTSQDYFEVANALKQKGGREAASPETRAQRAEERRQSRRDALRNAALAVPEKFDVLESRVWTSYLKPWRKDGDGAHTALSSRSAAECLIAGYNESLDHEVAVRTSGKKHVLTGVNPSLGDTRLVQICADPKCPYTFAFTTEPPKKADKDGRWHLEKFTPHSARCVVPERARTRKCHYSGPQLAAILLESEPEDIFAVEPKAAKRLLNPYIVAKPDDDLAHRAIHASVERLYGKEKDHLKRLPHTIDELSNLDYETSTFTTNSRGMDEIIKMRAQSEHKVGDPCIRSLQTCERRVLVSHGRQSPRQTYAGPPTVTRLTPLTPRSASTGIYLSPSGRLSTGRHLTRPRSRPRRPRRARNTSSAGPSRVYLPRWRCWIPAWSPAAACPTSASARAWASVISALL